MTLPRIVIDTSVWVASLRTRRGASYQLLELIDSGQFETAVSVSLILEYEGTARRLTEEISLSAQDIDDILDYICTIGIHQKISYLWRPYLADPDDDMVLELAVNASCNYIVTFNVRHFKKAQDFGLRILTPGEFLNVIGALA